MDLLIIIGLIFVYEKIDVLTKLVQEKE